MKLRCLSFVLALLAGLVAVPQASAQNKIFHLAIGDPARRDREAPLVLDGITDTKTASRSPRWSWPRRLSGVQLLLVGEEHTNMEFHRVQLRVLQALVEGRPARAHRPRDVPLHRAARTSSSGATGC